jgi:hypothetical protein
LILFTVRLLAVASVWFALWLVYIFFVVRYFPPRPDHELSSYLSAPNWLCPLHSTLT